MVERPKSLKRRLFFFVELSIAISNDKINLG